MSKSSFVIAAVLAVCMVGNTFGGNIYWVSPSGKAFPGYQGVTTATSGSSAAASTWAATSASGVPDFR